MPRVVVTAGAVRGLERCRQFLAEKDSRAAGRAGSLIERQFLLLEGSPEIGRPLDEQPELRELVIGFGEAGYVALYQYAPGDEAVFVLAFRHQKEAGY
ncbi:type II toxin-antitoxin system RelE/ParE family toxin (plasmid) [Lichenicola cladoniae]|uniref:Type II toxin-antitoxin system RelE/ParE family toxin n=1 Tax=Lichenicola cladoniae TaxID=1484109 RepID=A0A6M8HZS0_9PROT|nr:type II toxin-antitoxin system RelE/ParE family toxin [Lichenicola cladoniae]NPD69792.1 type II toxin-antitoxin system RelE/ParE family toxin [Acetobacteraceae bacterium]QKE94023.1 type II toxin-antitoxin system RelE/ParE family toxin [Lichenicola cladoniae]